MSLGNQTGKPSSKPSLSHALFITFLSSTSQMPGWYLAELSLNISQSEQSNNCTLPEAQACHPEPTSVGEGVTFR